jgi:dihydrodipicolinate synthase/N-acetylneuraminate lyase
MYDYDFAKYEGLFIATVTLLIHWASLDLKTLGRVASYQAAIPGVAGLVPCARIGEGTVPTLEE